MVLKKVVTDRKYDEFVIEELSDLIQLLKDEIPADMFTIFRGQRKDWSLLPKLARHPDLGVDVLKAESEMISDYRRQLVSLREQVPDNDWDLLSFAQHYGLPTRMLDWTKIAFVALWFVVREPAIGNESGVLWSFFPSKNLVISDPKKKDPFQQDTVKVFIPQLLAPRIFAQESIFTVHNYIQDKKQWMTLENDFVSCSRGF